MVSAMNILSRDILTPIYYRSELVPSGLFQQIRKGEINSFLSCNDPPGERLEMLKKVVIKRTSRETDKAAGDRKWVLRICRRAFS
jgi:hypothetical protein